MKRVVDTTDGKHVGDIIDPSDNPVVFSDGATMYVTKISDDGLVLANSNYVIILTQE